MDPYVWEEFKNIFWTLVQKIPPLRKTAAHRLKILRQTELTNEPLCQFANSVFNFEYVYLILFGINGFIDQADMLMENNESILNERMQLNIQRKNRVTEVNFVGLKFDDVEKWNVKSKSKYMKQVSLNSDLEDTNNEVLEEYFKMGTVLTEGNTNQR